MVICELRPIRNTPAPAAISPAPLIGLRGTGGGGGGGAITGGPAGAGTTTTADAVVGGGVTTMIGASVLASGFAKLSAAVTASPSTGMSGIITGFRPGQ